MQDFLFMEEVIVQYSPVQDPLNAIEVTSAAFAWPSPETSEKAIPAPTSNGCAANQVKETQNGDIKMPNPDLDNEMGTLLQSESRRMECLSPAIMGINLKIPKVGWLHESWSLDAEHSNHVDIWRTKWRCGIKK